MGRKSVVVAVLLEHSVNMATSRHSRMEMAAGGMLCSGTRLWPSHEERPDFCEASSKVSVSTVHKASGGGKGSHEEWGVGEEGGAPHFRGLMQSLHREAAGYSTAFSHGQSPSLAVGPELQQRPLAKKGKEKLNSVFVVLISSQESHRYIDDVHDNGFFFSGLTCFGRATAFLRTTCNTYVEDKTSAKTF